MGRVIINIVIAIAAFFSVQGVFLLVRFFKFELPFTNEMISKGVIELKLKKQLLLVELLPKIITTIIPISIGLIVLILQGIVDILYLE